MAINHFEVDTGILRQNTDDFSQQLNKMRSLFDDMFDGVNSLDSMWAGKAHDAFKTQFAADKETCEAFCKSVDEYIECLDYAKKEYDDCENKVHAAVDAVKIG